MTGAGGTVIEPKRDPDGRLIYEVSFGGVSNLNNARLPNFARIDARASWKPRGARGRWEYYLEVINVLNRENASALSAELAHDPTSDRPRIFERRSGGLTLVPTIGVRWRF
jgi:outer membrane receptor protein involved in Fe transport